MDEEIKRALNEQSQKIEAVYVSVEKTRKYFMWMLIVSVAVVIIPLVGLMVVIPQFLSVYSGLEGLGL